MNGPLSEQEKHCHEMLRMLRDAYERQAEPYIRRLVHIAETRMNQRFVYHDGPQSAMMETPSPTLAWPGKGY